MKNFIKNKNKQNPPKVEKFVPNHKLLGYDFGSLDGQVVDSNLSEKPPYQQFNKPQEMFAPLNKDELVQNRVQATQSNVQVETGNLDNSDLINGLAESETGSYIVLIDFVPVCSGPKEEIAEVVGDLLYGHHEICEGQEIELSRILVLKKVNFYVSMNLDS